MSGMRDITEDKIKAWIRERPKPLIMSLLLDLEDDLTIEFYTLEYALFKAEKQQDRAKIIFNILCFIHKHLGNDMLEVFIDRYIVDNPDARHIISAGIRLRGSK